MPAWSRALRAGAALARAALETGTGAAGLEVTVWACVQKGQRAQGGRQGCAASPNMVARNPWRWATPSCRDHCGRLFFDASSTNFVLGKKSRSTGTRTAS
jgi:hypothetical protein